MSMRSLFAGLAAVILLSAPTAPAAAPPGDAAETLIHKVYPVADLIVPLDGTAASACGKDAPKTLEECLIRLIESSISPRTWGCLGGEGSIDYFPIGMALVVRQSSEVHEQIGDLLAALRRLQDVEVTVELRFLTVSDECLAKLGVADGGESQPGLLDDTQVRLLLETVQADPSTNIMQAPKMTVFSGQKAVLDLSEKQCFVTGVETVTLGDRKIFSPRTKNVNTGLQVSMLPVVAPDNRTVSLQLGVNLVRMDAPKPPAGALTWTIKPDSARPNLIPQPALLPRSNTRAFETTVKMTDGATALLRGWTHHREARNLAAAPVLSKVPYINRLFHNFSYGKEGENLLVMVTPHVIVRREQEEHVPAQEDYIHGVPVEAAPQTNPDAPPAASPQRKPKRVPEGETTAAWEVEAPWSPPQDVSPRAAEPASPAPAELHVHRRSFRLDYALDNVGPTGVSKVAVWYVRGAGAWMQYDGEVPAKGHATITVPEDGRWGFTLIPYSGAGLSQGAPKAGEPPQVWVEVDTRTPQVSITSASARLVHGEGVLQVQYCSEDAHLKSKPVTISYSATREGPWTILATERDAVDLFSCSLEGLPAEFYVRVEAADQAGNVGQAAELIKADLKIPKVREVKVKAEE